MKQQHTITKAEKLSPLCQGNCKICNSEHTELIHKLIANNKTYREISNYLKKEKNFEVSHASISRHYQKHKEYKKIILQKKLTEKIQTEADKLVNHQKNAIKLADLVYERLLFQFENRNFNVDISDWEKVVKMYHQVLLGKGEGDEGKNLQIIFQQMQDRYGDRRQQMALKFGGDDAPAEQKKEDDKEEH